MTPTNDPIVSRGASGGAAESRSSVAQGVIALVIWLSWALFVIGLALSAADLPIPPWIPVVPGLVAGALLWPV